MTPLIAAVKASGPLTSWRDFWLLNGGFVAAVITLALVGRSMARATGDRDAMRWIPTALERITRIPGWAAAMACTALFGLFEAGEGFYNDVAWHVALGR